MSTLSKIAQWIGRAYRGAIHRGARVLVVLGVRPNVVTLGSVVIAAIACVLFAVTHNVLLFASLVLLGGYCDALDGEVARQTDSTTAFGGYLDAICDRIFDSLVLLTIAWVSQYWVLCTLVLVGSYSVSYFKARAALEVPISNLGWPHLMGREERVLTLVGGLVLWGLDPERVILGIDWLSACLLIMAAGLFVTAAQRIRFARRLMEAK